MERCSDLAGERVAGVGDGAITGVGLSDGHAGAVVDAGAEG